MAPKILLVCETSNFKVFTRRATTEAIKKENDSTEAIAHLSIRKFFKKELKSAFFDNIPYLTSYKIPMFNYRLTVGIKKIKAFDEPNNVIVLSSPTQHFILDYIKPNAKLAFILSDPYHLMGYKYDDTRKILSNAEVIFATSKSLAKHYMSKYFPSIDAKVIYWPNTVDTNFWDIKRFERKNYSENNTITVGHAGNITKITDLRLLDYITSRCLNMNFEIAGKLKIKSEDNLALFHKIRAKDNVKYLGYINYESIPEKVYEWDIGILIDKRNEISSYIHHNKLYQYLALGKPVAAHQNHDDYGYLDEVVYLADDYEEFVKGLKKVIDRIDDQIFIKKAIKLMQANNADKRAKKFLKELSNET